MNVFILDESPEASARALADVHVGKQLLEILQMFATAHGWQITKLDGGLYQPTHPYHPVTQFICLSRSFTAWCMLYCEYLCVEFQSRFHKPHGCETSGAVADARAQCMEHVDYYHDVLAGGVAAGCVMCPVVTTGRVPEYAYLPEAVPLYREYYRQKMRNLNARYSPPAVPPAWLYSQAVSHETITENNS